MLKTTTVGSYPRKDKPKDTLRKPTVSEEEALDMVQWAVEDQCSIGLDYITDGESYRENMYWFYQLRIDGVDSTNKKYKQFRDEAFTSKFGKGFPEMYDKYKDVGEGAFGAVFQNPDDPSRVFKGMKMAGRTGGERVKMINLQVLKVIPEKNILIVKGSVPGSKGSYLIVEK